MADSCYECKTMLHHNTFHMYSVHFNWDKFILHRKRGAGRIHVYNEC